jgi:hypothetical protein
MPTGTTMSGITRVNGLRACERFGHAAGNGKPAGRNVCVLGFRAGLGPHSLACGMKPSPETRKTHSRATGMEPAV